MIMGTSNPEADDFGRQIKTRSRVAFSSSGVGGEMQKL